jgi:prepilin-type processing-associated H-X9-DG protein
MFLFSADHENKFPESGEQSVTWGATDSSTGEPSWMQQLGPYVGNPSNPTLGTIPSVFTCPSSGQTKIGEKYYSYFNGCHAAWAQLTSAGEPAKPAAIRRTLVIMPAEQILSGDITNTTWDTSGGKLDADKNDYTVNPIQTQSTYHNGSINLLFADGHVEVEKWNTNLSPPGYFDQTRMCTHYQGTVNGGQPYLTP